MYQLTQADCNYRRGSTTRFAALLGSCIVSIHSQNMQSATASALITALTMIGSSTPGSAGSTAVSIAHVCSGTPRRSPRRQTSSTSAKYPAAICLLELLWVLAPPLNWTAGTAAKVMFDVFSASVLQKAIATMLPSLNAVIWPYPAIGSGRTLTPNTPLMCTDSCSTNCRCC
jgi:hypothetical protein